LDIVIGIAALITAVIAWRRRRQRRPQVERWEIERDQRRLALMPLVLGVGLLTIIAVMGLLYR
jgi:uncharacterized iron-regulated membrane protein